MNVRVHVLLYIVAGFAIGLLYIVSSRRAMRLSYSPLKWLLIAICLNHGLYTWSMAATALLKEILNDSQWDFAYNFNHIVFGRTLLLFSYVLWCVFLIVSHVTIPRTAANVKATLINFSEMLMILGTVGFGSLAIGLLVLDLRFR
ncbi:hypothetical protein L596_000735 [Steinernema carpocapsae]|uniref:Uncharacterized protein n=1 Tax=Steinernema carpocapsae TaxID=34508 RepID=A0A4U8ULF3_STECR|nr:hypothetical protein L596_000735 [Steinernema carpocapsae]